MPVEHPIEGPLPWAEASEALNPKGLAMATEEPHTDPGYSGGSYTHRIGSQIYAEPAEDGTFVTSQAHLETTVDEAHPTDGRIDLSYIEATVDPDRGEVGDPTIVQLSASQTKGGDGEFRTTAIARDTFLVDSVVPPALATVTSQDFAGTGVITGLEARPADPGFPQLEPETELADERAIARRTAYNEEVRRAIGLPSENSSAVAVTVSPLDRLRAALVDIGGKIDMSRFLGRRSSGSRTGGGRGGLTYISSQGGKR